MQTLISILEDCIQILKFPILDGPVPIPRAPNPKGSIPIPRAGVIVKVTAAKRREQQQSMSDLSVILT